MAYSKSKVDDAGLALSLNKYKSDDHQLDSEIIFDEYRQSHLQPLTEATLQIQSWLSKFEGKYYIAQRLKRKPQILRKLRRFSVRLTQLQDVGGNRVIVDTNEDVDRLRRYILDHLGAQSEFTVQRETDYRILGRDDTGYRSLHILLKARGHTLELQLRSQAQHYWAECIERTSVVYGHHLKEKEGDLGVIDYFKLLSRLFFEIESSREPSPQDKMELDNLRIQAEVIIANSAKGGVLHSHVSDDVLHALSEMEQKRPGVINNWILVFDWNSGHFVNWEAISRNPAEAYKAYIKNEHQYNEVSGYEVVLVGSSDVSMIRKTHSHYFGIDGYDSILKSLDQSILGFTTRQPLDAGCRKILHTLMRKRYWGAKTVGMPTLKNHFCKSVFGFETAIQKLADLGLINLQTKKGPISLNQSRQDEIQNYL